MSESAVPAERPMLAALDYVRSPEHGIAGQGLRFIIAGAVSSTVYLGTTLLLADAAGVPFQLALAIGFLLGICAHFTLQRLFVWVHHEAFALPIGSQLMRYGLNAGFQYGLTVLTTSLLPHAFDVQTEVVYLCTFALVTLLNFVVFRHGIFHPAS